MAQYDELVSALVWLLTNRVQNKIQYSHGLLGDGQGRVRVAGNDDFVYVRPDRFSSRTLQVFNKRVEGQDGDPIIIGELPWEPGLIQVISIDWRTYKEIGWGSDLGFVSYHGKTHIWRDAAPGLDTFPVYRRQLGDLQATASVSGSSAVDISSYSIEIYGEQKQFPGVNGFDLTAAIPTTTGSSRMALLYWDPVSGTTGYIGVATGTTGIESESTLLNRPVSLPGTVPIAFIRLKAGQTGLTEFDIFDAREPFRPGIGFGTGSSQMHAGLIPIIDEADYFTGSSVETALQELGGGAGVTGPAGGDLTGSYPNPTVAGIYNQPILGAETLQLGDVLQFTGSAWRPTPLSVSTFDEITFFREGVIVTGSNVDRSHIFTTPGILEFAYIHLKGQGSTGSTIADFNLNDTTIFTDQSKRPVIIGGSATKVDKSDAPDLVHVSEYDILTMDIDSVANNAVDLSATVLVRRIASSAPATTTGLDVIEANFHGGWLESHWTFGGPDGADSLDEVLFFDGF